MLNGSFLAGPCPAVASLVLIIVPSLYSLLYSWFSSFFIVLRSSFFLALLDFHFFSSFLVFFSVL